MKTRVKALLFGFAASACLSGLAVAGGAPDPDELLGKALADPKVPYTAHVALTQWFGSRTKAEEANVSFSPPNKYRWEFLSPSGGVSRVVVSDGDTEFVWLPRRHKVLEGAASKTGSKLIAPEEELALLTKNYTVSLAGQEQAAGRPAWRLDISPVEAGKPHQELWVDQETNIVLQNKRIGAEKARVSLSRFVRFNPGQDVPEEVFHLKISSATQTLEHALDPAFLSVEELKEKAGKSFDAPADLPGGFVFESGDRYVEKGTSVLYLRYTDGLAIVSLFETNRPVHPRRKQSGETGSAIPVPREFASGKVLQWSSGRRHYTLVGDVSDPLLNQIATRLKTTP